MSIGDVECRNFGSFYCGTLRGLDDIAFTRLIFAVFCLFIVCFATILTAVLNPWRWLNTRKGCCDFGINPDVAYDNIATNKYYRKFHNKSWFQRIFLEIDTENADINFGAIKSIPAALFPWVEVFAYGFFLHDFLPRDNPKVFQNKEDQNAFEPFLLEWAWVIFCVYLGSLGAITFITICWRLCSKAPHCTKASANGYLQCCSDLSFIGKSCFGIVGNIRNLYLTVFRCNGETTLAYEEAIMIHVFFFSFPMLLWNLILYFRYYAGDPVALQIFCCVISGLNMSQYAYFNDSKALLEESVPWQFILITWRTLGLLVMMIVFGAGCAFISGYIFMGIILFEFLVRTICRCFNENSCKQDILIKTKTDEGGYKYEIVEQHFCNCYCTDHCKRSIYAKASKFGSIITNALQNIVMFELMTNASNFWHNVCKVLELTGILIGLYYRPELTEHWIWDEYPVNHSGYYYDFDRSVFYEIILEKVLFYGLIWMVLLLMLIIFENFDMELFKRSNVTHLISRHNYRRIRELRDRGLLVELSEYENRKLVHVAEYGERLLPPEKFEDLKTLYKLGFPISHIIKESHKKQDCKEYHPIWKTRVQERMERRFGKPVEDFEKIFDSEENGEDILKELAKFEEMHLWHMVRSESFEGNADIEKGWWFDIDHETLKGADIAFHDLKDANIDAKHKKGEVHVWLRPSRVPGKEEWEEEKGVESLENSEKMKHVTILREVSLPKQENDQSDKDEQESQGLCETIAKHCYPCVTNSEYCCPYGNVDLIAEISDKLEMFNLRITGDPEFTFEEKKETWKIKFYSEKDSIQSVELHTGKEDEEIERKRNEEDENIERKRKEEDENLERKRKEEEERKRKEKKDSLKKIIKETVKNFSGVIAFTRSNIEEETLDGGHYIEIEFKAPKFLQMELEKTHTLNITTWQDVDKWERGQQVLVLKGCNSHALNTLDHARAGGVPKPLEKADRVRKDFMEKLKKKVQTLNIWLGEDAYMEADQCLHGERAEILYCCNGEVMDVSDGENCPKLDYSDDEIQKLQNMSWVVVSLTNRSQWTIVRADHVRKEANLIPGYGRKSQLNILLHGLVWAQFCIATFPFGIVAISQQLGRTRGQSKFAHRTCKLYYFRFCMNMEIVLCFIYVGYFFFWFFTCRWIFGYGWENIQPWEAIYISYYFFLLFFGLEIVVERYCCPKNRQLKLTTDLDPKINQGGLELTQDISHVHVAHVEKNSQAEFMGFQVGDIINGVKHYKRNPNVRKMDLVAPILDKNDCRNTTKIIKMLKKAVEASNLERNESWTHYYSLGDQIESIPIREHRLDGVYEFSVTRESDTICSTLIETLLRIFGVRVAVEHKIGSIASVKIPLVSSIALLVGFAAFLILDYLQTESNDRSLLVLLGAVGGTIVTGYRMNQFLLKAVLALNPDAMELVVPEQPFVSHQILSVWLDGCNALQSVQLKEQNDKHHINTAKEDTNSEHEESEILFLESEELTRVAAEVGKFAEEKCGWPEGSGAEIFNIILSFRSIPGVYLDQPPEEADMPLWFNRSDIKGLDVGKLQKWCYDNQDTLYSEIRKRLRTNGSPFRGGNSANDTGIASMLKELLKMYRHHQQQLEMNEIEEFVRTWEIEVKQLGPDDLPTEEYFQEMLLLLTSQMPHPEEHGGAIEVEHEDAIEKEHKEAPQEAQGNWLTKMFKRDPARSRGAGRGDP